MSESLESALLKWAAGKLHRDWIGHSLLRSRFFTVTEGTRETPNSYWGHWIEVEAGGKPVAYVRATSRKGKATIYVREGIPVETFSDKKPLWG